MPAKKIINTLGRRITEFKSLKPIIHNSTLLDTQGLIKMCSILKRKDNQCRLTYDKQDIRISRQGFYSSYNLYRHPRAVITKYHRLDGLNYRNTFSHSSRSRKSIIKVPAGLVSPKASLFGCRWPPSLHVLTWPFLCIRAHPRNLSLFL